MQQVADLAGVSIATVSFVVNGTKRVSPQTAARVHSAMKELGFRNNIVARALASKRTRIIALLFPAFDNRMRASSLDFFTAAAARSSELGYHLVLWPNEPSGDDLDDLISGGLVDGVILMEVKMEDPRIVKLRELNVPFASIGRTRDTTDLPFVDIDFEQTMEDGLDYLQSLGHTHFGLIIEDLETGSMAGYAPHLRTQTTFVESCRRRGVTGTITHCGPSTMGGHQAAIDLVAADPEVSAVLMMKDDSLTGTIEGFRSLGKRIPDDISLLTIASAASESAQHVPSLSVMVSPADTLGRLSADALIGQLEGTLEELPHGLIPCALLVGGSTAPAPVRVPVPVEAAVEAAIGVDVDRSAIPRVEIAAPTAVAAVPASVSTSGTAATSGASAPARRRRRTPTTAAGS